MGDWRVMIHESWLITETESRASINGLFESLMILGIIWVMTHDSWFMVHHSFLTHESWLMLHDSWFITHDSWLMIHDSLFWPFLKEAHRPTHSYWLSFAKWGEEEDDHKLSAPIPAMLTRQVKRKRDKFFTRGVPGSGNNSVQWVT